jgi:hypothetical protein
MTVDELIRGIDILCDHALSLAEIAATVSR